MKIIRKDWFDYIGKQVVLLWTSNLTITRHGNAVMGRGLAKQITTKYPMVKEMEGKALAQHKIIGKDTDKYGNECSYSFAAVHSVAIINGTIVGAFPVKIAWWGSASLKTIKRSTVSLAKLIDMGHIDRPVVMNFPGIGAGHLRHEFNNIKSMLQEVLGDRDVTILLKPKSATQGLRRDRGETLYSSSAKDEDPGCSECSEAHGTGACDGCRHYLVM